MRYRGARGKGKEKQMRNGIVIDKRDNVVVAIYELEGGTEVTYTLPDGSEETLTTNEQIPLFHKIARDDIAEGAVVTKYGEYIGVATCDIKKGDHVHTHNCASNDDIKDAEGNE